MCTQICFFAWILLRERDDLGARADQVLRPGRRRGGRLHGIFPSLRRYIVHTPGGFRSAAGNPLGQERRVLSGTTTSFG